MKRTTAQYNVRSLYTPGTKSHPPADIHVQWIGCEQPTQVQCAGASHWEHWECSTGPSSSTPSLSRMMSRIPHSTFAVRGVRSDPHCEQA
jgi:hypothetical protein